MITINFTTDISGANNPIHSASSRTFNFTLNNTYLVGKGAFDMKRGTSSSDGVTATIYSGLNASGPALTSIFVNAASFPTTFTVVDFIFNYELSSGQYSLVMTSSDPSGGATQYAIKTDSFKTINTETNTTLQLFDQEGKNLLSTKNLKLGSSAAAALKIGSSTLNRAYLGTNLMWDIV